MKSVSFRGVTYKSQAELCRVYNCSYRNFMNRRDHGASIEDALGADDKLLKPETFYGITCYTYYEICKHFHTDYTSLMKRVNDGESLKQIVDECVDKMTDPGIKEAVNKIVEKVTKEEKPSNNKKVTIIPVKEITKTIKPNPAKVVEKPVVKADPVKVEPVVEKPVVKVKESTIKPSPVEPVIEKKKSIIGSTKIISSVMRLTEEIKASKSNKVFLIDYENVVGYKETLFDLNKEGQTNVFFFNATLYSNDYYKLLRHLTDSNNYQVMTFEVSSQLVDHMITFYLGNLLAQFPEKEYVIVSRDKGYNSLIESLNCSNITIQGNDLPDKVDKYKLSLAKYINRHLSFDTTYAADVLQYRFAKFYAEKGELLGYNQFQDLTKNLVAFGFMTRTEKQGSEFYKVNRSAIEEAINNFKEE